MGNAACISSTVFVLSPVSHCLVYYWNSPRTAGSAWRAGNAGALTVRIGFFFVFFFFFWGGVYDTILIIRNNDWNRVLGYLILYSESGTPQQVQVVIKAPVQKEGLDFRAWGF